MSWLLESSYPTTEMSLYITSIIAFIIASWFLRKIFTPVHLVIKSGYTFLKNPGTYLELLSEFQDTYPDIFRVRLTFKRCYYISKPEYFEKVLSSPHAIDKAEVYSYMDEFFGPNIFTAPENMWRRQRKILNLSFNQKSIDSYSGVFLEEAENLTEKLVNVVSRSNKDIQNLIHTSFTHVVCRTLFDVRYELDVDTHVKELERLLSSIASRGIKWFYKWTGPKSSITEKFGKTLSYGQAIGKDIISEKQKQLAENKELLEDGKLYSESTKRTCMLENILERPEFTDERAMSELVLFILAGNETSTATLLFTFIALALNPDIQERLYEEVVNICGLDGPVTLEHLPHIEYADRVIKESLRIFPVGPIQGRHIQEDLDIGDKVLPKNSTVFLNVIHTHRNPKYWREPLKFDPDRFSKENVSKVYPFSYIPFSYGARNCIGNRFAMTSMKITLITIIRKAKIFTDYKSIEDVRLKSHFTLRPMKGWKVRFEARS